MNSYFKFPRPLRATLGTLVLAPSLIAFSAHAQTEEDAGYRQYRCTVLGDSRACPPPAVTPAERVETRTIVGPYASHLLYLGWTTDAAIAEARTLGEVPVLRTVRITSRRLSDAEAHERYLGRLTPPEQRQDILAEVPLDTKDARARHTVQSPPL